VLGKIDIVVLSCGSAMSTMECKVCLLLQHVFHRYLRVFYNSACIIVFGTLYGIVVDVIEPWLSGQKCDVML